jgi:DNA-binding HxlR family transcriptional regulator
MEEGTFLCLYSGGMIDLEGIDTAHHGGVSALAKEMREHGHLPADPMREIFGFLGDRWTTLILLVLQMGTWRHAELKRAISRLGSEGKISQRVMTSKLRALERDGLVARETSAYIPPRVSYALTLSGASLVGEIDRLRTWVHASQSDIKAARKRFDSNTKGK